MSADKQKRRARAFAFLRLLYQGGRGFPVGVGKETLSGPLSRTVRYCLDKGYATLRRTRPGELRGARARHNLLDAE